MVLQDVETPFMASLVFFRNRVPLIVHVSFSTG